MHIAALPVVVPLIGAAMLGGASLILLA